MSKLIPFDMIEVRRAALDDEASEGVSGGTVAANEIGSGAVELDVAASTTPSCRTLVLFNLLGQVPSFARLRGLRLGVRGRRPN